MEEERNIKVTLEQAMKWYNSGDSTLRTLALSAYTEDELKLDFKYINSKVCNTCFCANVPVGEVLEEPNNAPNRKQLERLLALNKLMNIAYYYNGKQYMRVGYYIGYDKLKDVYFVEDLDNSPFEPAGMAAMFMYAKDAQAVIDNPNFRDILDTLCK